MANMPWAGDIAHTRLSNGRVVLRGSDAAVHDLLERQAEFDSQVALGKCIICSGPSEPGTRYCAGDRGCRHG